jgi:hypothetical protein
MYIPLIPLDTRRTTNANTGFAPAGSQMVGRQVANSDRRLKERRKQQRPTSFKDRRTTDRRSNRRRHMSMQYAANKQTNKPITAARRHKEDRKGKHVDTRV